MQGFSPWLRAVSITCAAFMQTVRTVFTTEKDSCRKCLCSPVSPTGTSSSKSNRLRSKSNPWKKKFKRRLRHVLADVCPVLCCFPPGALSAPPFSPFPGQPLASLDNCEMLSNNSGSLRSCSVDTDVANRRCHKVADKRSLFLFQLSGCTPLRILSDVSTDNCSNIRTLRCYTPSVNERKMFLQSNGHVRLSTAVLIPRDTPCLMQGIRLSRRSRVEDDKRLIHFECKRYNRTVLRHRHIALFRSTSQQSKNIFQRACFCCLWLRTQTVEGRICSDQAVALMSASALIHDITTQVRFCKQCHAEVRWKVSGEFAI